MSEETLARMAFHTMVAARAASVRWTDLLIEIHASNLDLMALRAKPVHHVTVAPGLMRIDIPADELIAAVQRRRAEAMASMMLEFPGATEEQVSEYVRAWGRDQ